MCGLLLVNKPSGITSFAVVAKIKKITGEKHVGHTGTLDPMATGVLPVLIGRATKLSDLMLCKDKCYKARIKLGVTTDTLDITGNILSEKPISVNIDEVDEALNRFTGEIMQSPPAFSAIKRDGVPLYRLAREGKEVEIGERKVTVFSLNRETDINKDNEFEVSCRVSKGTYIRSLARDIGEYLKTGATLTALCRTNTAGFDIKDCVCLDKLNKENISDYILPADFAVRDLKAVNVTKPQAVRFSNGGCLDFMRLPYCDYADGENVKIYYKDEFLGVAVAEKYAGALKVRCIINSAGKE